MSDKTEEATPKRLQKAREEGDSPISAFASQAVAFLAAVTIAPAAVRALTIQSSASVRAAIGRASDPSPSVAVDLPALASSVVVLTAPVLLAAGVVAAVAAVVQSGGVIATKKLVPKLERLDVVAGLKQLFSANRAIAVVRALLFAVGVAWFALQALHAHAAFVVHTVGRPHEGALLAASIVQQLTLRAAFLGLFLAVLDIVVTRRSWRKKLRMSKDEVKREHKENDGNPELKAARERAHHELLASAVVARVKTASVVVVNPTHLACALRYDDEGGDEAPVLVASGQGDLAARIVEAARVYGVPVLRDVPLARALIELEIGQAIPEALYEAVAEILREAWEATEAPDAG